MMFQFRFYAQSWHDMPGPDGLVVQGIAVPACLTGSILKHNDFFRVSMPRVRISASCLPVTLALEESKNSGHQLGGIAPLPPLTTNFYENGG